LKVAARAQAGEAISMAELTDLKVGERPIPLKNQLSKKSIAL
jgi:hypothetical protein